MKKLCINNRDEMILLSIDEIAYVMADGNYVSISYITGKKCILSLGLSKFFEMITKVYGNVSVCPFIKLGRSVIVNQTYLYEINILKQLLTLSDNKMTFSIKMPKQLLKSYREMILSAQKNNNRRNKL